MYNKRKFVFIMLLFCSISNAQIFSTANLLQNKRVAFSINPVLKTGIVEDDAGMYLHGDLGIGSAMQLGAQLGLGFDETYIGLMVKKSLNRKFPNMSFSGGIHSFGDIGLDFALSISGPMNRLVVLYSGLDLDIDFSENRRKESETRFLSWFFLGTEVAVGRNMTFLFEAEIGIADEAYNLFGSGLKLYF